MQVYTCYRKPSQVINQTEKHPTQNLEPKTKKNKKKQK